MKSYSIEPCEFPDSPRDDSNIGIMACFHTRYDLGDKVTFSHKDFNSWAEMETFIKLKEKATAILPLYLYDHSGLSISTKPFACKFDSGQIGFIFTRKTGNVEEIYRTLQAEVDVYDTYISDGVWDVLIYENGEVVDTITNVYGWKDAEDIAKEACSEISSSS